MDHTEKAAGDKINAETTARGAGATVSRAYVRPGLTEDIKQQEANRRADLADQRLNQFGNINRAPSSVSNGKVQVQADFANTPPGTKVGLKSAGAVNAPAPNVAYPISVSVIRVNI